MPRRLAIAALVVVLVQAPLAASTAQDAVALTEDAVKMIQEERLPEALQLLDRALATDPDRWEAHYQRGRVLGLLDRMEESRDALLRAVHLNPGFAHGHSLAWLAAFNVGDYETAWEQAIQAEVAGTDMSENFKQLMAVSSVPDDILDRLAAPRVFVDGFDLSEISARAELPYDRNFQAQPNTVDDRPDDQQGAFRAQEAQAELIGLHRQLRRSVADSPYLGLVLDPEQAQYVLRVAVDRLGVRNPRDLEGYLQMFELASGESGYRRNFELRDISSAGAMTGELERIIDDIEAWIIDLREVTGS